MPMIPCFNCDPRGEGTADPSCPYCSGKGQIQTDAETAKGVNEAVRLRRLNVKPERYPVAIAANEDGLMALANDGTMWISHDDGESWDALSALPPPESGL